ncbi:MAG: DNA alkylation repair protein [Bifidobacteriaceae bacterium]|nr:DNA alkylation repair protein [Bifidobacteriaceae bacterium]
MDLDEAIAALRGAANADDAGPMAAYMKNVAPFLGVKKPGRAKAAGPLLAAARRRPWEEAELLGAMERLAAEPEREFHYLAIDLFGASAASVAWPALTGRVVPFLDHRPWWDTVDALRAEMGRWTRARPVRLRPLAARLASGSMWARRAAITLQLQWKDGTDRAVLANAIEANQSDPEFFIQKAIGWALRDFARTDPIWVRAFLADHTLTPLARREASKHLP